MRTPRKLHYFSITRFGVPVPVCGAPETPTATPLVRNVECVRCKRWIKNNLIERSTTR